MASQAGQLIFLVIAVIAVAFVLTVVFLYVRKRRKHYRRRRRHDRRRKNMAYQQAWDWIRGRKRHLMLTDERKSRMPDSP